MYIPSIVLITSLLAQLTCADWQFRSRPDLSVPRWNITVSTNREALEKGYIFIAPYNGFVDGARGPEQEGAYIFRDDGDLVWSSVGTFGGWITNFQASFWRGKPILRAFEGLLDAAHGRMYGKHTILNNRYEVIKTVKPASHRLVSCHEFRVLESGTVLVETPVAVPTNLSAWGGDHDQNWIVSGEIDIDTGKLVFEWYSLDHVDPKYSALPLRRDGPFNGRTSGDAWNYFHINSVDKDDEGNYLISARHISALFKIHGQTGKIIWQLGGHHGSSFSIPDNLEFAFQHDARFISRSSDSQRETISLFDNAAYSEPGHEISPFSRARILELNHVTGEAVELHTYPAPDSLSAHSQGNAQLLPNENVFVNWGQAGAITEFAKDGQVLFHAYLDSEPVGKLVQSYRGFRFNWTGIATEEPAIVALSRNTTDNVQIYVSWNGDTQVTAWRFYIQGKHHHDGVTRRILGEQKRRSFETVFSVDSSAFKANAEELHFSAEGIDVRGQVLVHTRTTPVHVDVWQKTEKGDTDQSTDERGLLIQ